MPASRESSPGRTYSKTAVWALTDVAIICVSYLFRLRFFNEPSLHDMFLFLPLVRSGFSSDPSGELDLLVLGGQEVPFYLYRLIALAMQTGAPETILLEVTFFLCHCLSFLACKLIIKSLGATPFETLLCAAGAVFFPSATFAVNWNLFPTQAPLSSALGFPLALMALGYALQGRTFLTIAFGIFAALFHPGFSLIGSILVAASSTFTSTWYGIAGRIRHAAGLTCLPVLLCLYIATQHGPLSTVDRTQFFGLLELFSHHIYPEFHFSAGFGLFFLSLYGLLYLARRILADGNLRKLEIIVASALLIWLVGLLNIQFGFSIPIALAFLSRALVFLKPLLIGVGVMAIYRVSPAPCGSKESFFRATGIGMLVLTIWAWGLAPSPSVDRNLGPPAILSILLLSLSTRESFDAQANRLKLLGLGAFAGLLLVSPSAELSSSLLILFALSALYFDLFRTSPSPASLIVVPSTLFLPRWHKLSTTALVLSIGAVCIAQADRLGERMRIPCPRNTESLFTWIQGQTPRNSVFVVKPDDYELTQSFRLCSNRGLYIGLPDINQLAYSPRFYFEGFSRLKKLGMTIVGSRTGTAYDHLSFASFVSHLNSDGLPSELHHNSRFVLVRNDDLPPPPVKLRLIYTDQYFSVLTW